MHKLTVNPQNIFNELINKTLLISSSDEFILSTNGPVELPKGNIDYAVSAPEWFDRTTEENQEINIMSLYLENVGKFKLLKPDEQIKLCKLAQAGDRDARNKVVCANLRLVVWCAMKFKSRLSLDSAFEFIDLIQEGNKGLIRALETFDPEKASFSTYATWWVRQFIFRAIDDHTRLIRLPVHMAEKIRKYNQTLVILSNLYGNAVPMEEVSRIMEITLEEAYILESVRVQNFTSVEGYMQKDDEVFRSYIPDRSKGADEKANEKDVSRILMKVLKMELNIKEYDVFVLRHGLDGKHSHTLEQVGKEYGVTRERIRQIEKKAFEKIKYHPELISLAKSMNLKVEKSTIEIANDLIKKKNEKRSLEDFKKQSIKKSISSDIVFKEIALPIDDVEKENKSWPNSMSVIQLVKVVSDFYNIDEGDIYAETRKPVIVKARHVAMFILNKIFNFSYSEIGRKIGGRDHATVMHACEKIEKEIETDFVLQKEISCIKKIL